MSERSSSSERAIGESARDEHAHEQPAGRPPAHEHGVVAIVGGTGAQGRGLAYRWALAGVEVVIGSRDGRRALDVADAIGFGVRGADNAATAALGDVVVVAVPWVAHDVLLRDLADVLVDKVVVDCVNPVAIDQHGAYAIDVPEGSAAQQAARLLPRSAVVAAFHHVSAVVLNDKNVPAIECDVLIAGDERHATDRIQALAGCIPGMRGIYAGRLRNARQLEALTATLISVNRRYRTRAGVRITGV